MPTKKYDSLDKAYQALTDLEIANDEKDMPCAIIKIPGISSIKITMVSEYDYYYILCPMRDKFINYYANRFVNEKQEIDQKKIIEKLNNFMNDILSVKEPEDVKKKSKTLSYLFEDISVRYEFYYNLKKLRLISRWISWRKYQKLMRPIDTLTIFCYLWLFNFDGLKKKTLDLFKIMNITLAGTNPGSLSVLSNSFNWDTYKKKLAEGSARVTKKMQELALQGNSNN